MNIQNIIWSQEHDTAHEGGGVRWYFGPSWKYYEMECLVTSILNMRTSLFELSFRTTKYCGEKLVDDKLLVLGIRDLSGVKKRLCKY